MTRPAKWALRIAGCLVMFAGLAGPAPGHVGGCGATVAVADPTRSCTEMQSWECNRDHAAGRISAAELSACLAKIDVACSGFQWPHGCAPLESQVEACTTLLRRADLLDQPNSEIRASPDCLLCQ